MAAVAAGVELWMVRHAQCRLNTPCFYERGGAESDPDELTQLGLRQTAKLCERLQAESRDHGDFTRVIMSNLPRAAATLSPLAAAPGCWRCMETSVALRELEPQGLLRRPQLAARAGMSYREWRPPGGESLDDLCDRASAFLSSLLRDLAPGQRALLVTHLGFIQEALQAVLGPSALQLPNARNTGIYVLHVLPKDKGLAVADDLCVNDFHFHIVLADDVSHLEAEEVTGGRSAKLALAATGGNCSVQKHSAMGCAVVRLCHASLRDAVLEACDCVDIGGVQVQVKKHVDKQSGADVADTLFVAWGRAADKRCPLSEFELVRFFDGLCDSLCSDSPCDPCPQAAPNRIPAAEVSSKQCSGKGGKGKLSRRCFVCGAIGHLARECRNGSGNRGGKG